MPALISISASSSRGDSRYPTSCDINYDKDEYNDPLDDVQNDHSNVVAQS